MWLIPPRFMVLLKTGYGVNIIKKENIVWKHIGFV
jgi:hypothetical protein